MSTQNGTSNAGGLSLTQQRQRAAFWFIAPMLAALFFVAAWPLIRTIWFSLTNTALSNLYGGEFIGFDNYLSLRILESGRWIWRGTLVDPAWWNAVWNTGADLPPGRPSFITRVLGVDSGRFRVGQARWVRRLQSAQAPGALLLATCCPAMNAA